MNDICILRLGHRPERDQRVTTHVGLIARALGAKGMYLAANDKGVQKSIENVVKRWGGDFFVENDVSWKKCIYEWKDNGGIVIHLTMYGLRMTDVIDEIRTNKKILIVAGAEKVPSSIYSLADYNVSVTTQPHSEISSVALILDHIMEGKELNSEYPDAQMKIIPTGCGKRFEE